MADIEALIKRRIVERQFDDVVRVLPPPPERKRREVDLDDNKASKVRACVYVCVPEWGGGGCERARVYTCLCSCV